MFFKHSKASEERVSDIELIERFRNSHNSGYVSQLLSRYLPYILIICSDILERDKDIEQAVKCIQHQLFNELKRHKIVDFKVWLKDVTRNECLKLLRKKNPSILSEKVAKLNGSAFLELRQEFDLIHVEIDQKNVISEMMKGLEWLNDEQSECIERFYLDRMSVKQVSDYTGYSISEVESHINIGKRNLEKFLIEKKNG